MKPISKLLPGWSEDGAREEGQLPPARLPQRIIISRPDLLGSLRMKTTHLHGGNIGKRSTNRAA